MTDTEYNLEDVGLVNKGSSLPEQSEELEKFATEFLNKKKKVKSKVSETEIKLDNYNVLLRKALVSLKSKMKQEKIGEIIVNVSFENRRTVIKNFSEIATTLERDINHLITFFCNELNAKCSLKDNNSLIIKGRYNTNYIEKLIHNYKLQYVVCKVCKNEKTSLQKDNINRLNYVYCSNCDSKQNVN